MKVKTSTMLAVRLHGPGDLRVEQVDCPGQPRAGEVLLRVRAVGVCGSDLHNYKDGGIGETVPDRPVILGHEFSGVVEAVGPDAMDGWHRPLAVGARVAVDPAQPCGHCDLCEQGHPNLCRNLHFCGLFPDDGALRERLLVPARTCFPLPEAVDFEQAALLEMLGVAIHTADLARVRVGESAAIIGAGPIGLSVLQMVKLAGADPVFVSEKLPWRLRLAEQYGAVPIDAKSQDSVAAVMRATGGQGVDTAIEAAWADESVQQAIDMLRNGGRLVQAGIPGDDRMVMRHSAARRKGLTIRLVRRMKHVYPRAIRLVERGKIDLKGMVTHRMSLAETPKAFALNSAYRDGVIKVVIEV